MAIAGSIVTIINQTGRPATFNLAPVSDKAVSLPPHGRIAILEEELAASEIQGAMSALPPRLAVVRSQTKVQPAENPAPQTKTEIQPMTMESTPTKPGASETTDRGETAMSYGGRKNKRAMHNR